MSCEDAPCCGCCTPMTEQDQREAEEAYWEMEEARDCPDNDEADDDDEPDGFLTDAEADGNALASAGFGTDEDYGFCEGYDEN